MNGVLFLFENMIKYELMNHETGFDGYIRFLLEFTS